MPGRDTIARVAPWFDVLAARGVEVHDAARAIYREFALLDATPMYDRGELLTAPLYFLPAEDVALDDQTLRRWASLAGAIGGHPVCLVAHTVGDHPGRPHVIVADDLGRVLPVRETGEDFLGENIDQAMELLFHGLEPPPVRDGRWTPHDDIPGPAAPREDDPLF
jgi:hypothetical protein